MTTLDHSGNIADHAFGAPPRPPLSAARWRLPATLGLSILLGVDALGRMAMMQGDVTLAGLQYLGALALSWLGVNMIVKMVDGFAVKNHLDDVALHLQELATAEADTAEMEQSTA